MSHCVYLVEERTELSNPLTCLLTAAGFQVLLFDRGEQALQAFRSTPPDVAVIDITRPGCNGLDLLSKVRQSTDCPVLLLSEAASEIDRILGLELGADDYVSKPFSAREIVARVRALFRRLEREHLARANEANRLVTYRNLSLNLDTKRLACDTRETALTFSEYDILSRLMTNPIKIYRREELLEPSLHKGESRAVDMHIANLRKKLKELAPGFRPIRAIRGMGYRFGI